VSTPLNIGGILPILMPAILAGMVLLFGNAFGAFRYRLRLYGGTLTMVTNVIAQEMSGDVLHNEALAYASRHGMICHHDDYDWDVYRAPTPCRALATRLTGELPMLRRFWPGLLGKLLACCIFFLPIYATFVFSLKAKKGICH
jgi:ABC-type spermidine/putrescine transport system permease subunit II